MLLSKTPWHPHKISAVRSHDLLPSRECIPINHSVDIAKAAIVQLTVHPRLCPLFIKLARRKKKGKKKNASPLGVGCHGNVYLANCPLSLPINQKWNRSYLRGLVTKNAKLSLMNLNSFSKKLFKLLKRKKRQKEIKTRIKKILTIAQDYF